MKPREIIPGVETPGADAFLTQAWHRIAIDQPPAELDELVLGMAARRAEERRNAHQEAVARRIAERPPYRPWLHGWRLALIIVATFLAVFAVTLVVLDRPPDAAQVQGGAVTGAGTLAAGATTGMAGGAGSPASAGVPGAVPEARDR